MFPPLLFLWTYYQPRLPSFGLPYWPSDFTEEAFLDRIAKVKLSPGALSDLAGDWLQVIPSPSLGLHLHDREFRCCLRYRLGVPMFISPFPCPECHAMVDVFGDHQVGCGGNRDRISRHNAIRDVRSLLCGSAATLAPTKEAPGAVPDSMSHPADIYLPYWSQG